MAGPAAALIAAGVTAGAGAIVGSSSAKASVDAQNAANEANRKEAVTQRGWQRMMDDSKYYRSVKDMRRAGLNPAVLFSGAGAPGGVPGGAQARFAPESGVSSAVEASRMVKEVAQGSAEVIARTKLMKEQAYQAKEQGQLAYSARQLNTEKAHGESLHNMMLERDEERSSRVWKIEKRNPGWAHWDLIHGKSPRLGSVGFSGTRRFR